MPGESNNASAMIRWAAVLGLAAAGCEVHRGGEVHGGGERAVDPSRLRFECGGAERLADGLFAIRAPCIRATVDGGLRRGAEIAFVYRGPTSRVEPLASGEVRRQIGLKLRARDTCNVVYAMWHIEPTGGVFVSVKANPGMTAHSQCRDGGYINLRPATRADIATIRPGERHTFAARIDGNVLRILADGALAWEGALPPEAFAFDGPIGIRSDNGEFDVELRERE
jgi:hypothetical protein